MRTGEALFMVEDIKAISRRRGGERR